MPGVGLGLTITQAIAVAHHGRIRVASTVGEGTTFALDLPLPAQRDPDQTLAWRRPAATASASVQK